MIKCVPFERLDVSEKKEFDLLKILPSKSIQGLINTSMCTVYPLVWKVCKREREHLQTLIEHGPLSTIYLVSIDSNTLSFIYFTYNQLYWDQLQPRPDKKGLNKSQKCCQGILLSLYPPSSWHSRTGKFNLFKSALYWWGVWQCTSHQSRGS